MTVETDVEVIPLDQLAKVYRKIKTRMDVVQKDFDTQLETLQGQLEEVKLAIKEQMKAQGAKSVKTDFGTLSLVTKTRYSTTDWDSFKQFIIDHEVVDLLEKRVAQLNMARFLEENPTLVPPGLNSTTEFEIKLYKAS